MAPVDVDEGSGGAPVAPVDVDEGSGAAAVAPADVDEGSGALADGGAPAVDARVEHKEHIRD